jgi:hypothetical protein
MKCPARADWRGPYGIRTRAAAVRGRCPRPLDEWAAPGQSSGGQERSGRPAYGRRCTPQSGARRSAATGTERRPGYNSGPVAGSSNGRTPDSGSGSQGSSPCPAASHRPDSGWVRCPFLSQRGCGYAAGLSDEARAGRQVPLTSTHSHRCIGEGRWMTHPSVGCSPPAMKDLCRFRQARRSFCQI